MICFTTVQQLHIIFFQKLGAENIILKIAIKERKKKICYEDFGCFRVAKANVMNGELIDSLPLKLGLSYRRILLFATVHSKYLLSTCPLLI